MPRWLRADVFHLRFPSKASGLTLGLEANLSPILDPLLAVSPPHPSSPAGTCGGWVCICLGNGFETPWGEFPQEEEGQPLG